MLGIFPEEIWIQIMFELPCYKILDLCIIPKFKQFCDKYNLIERRKIKGFPRKDGHCVIHDVSEIISCDYEDLHDLFLDPEKNIDGYSPLNEILIELIDDLDSNLVRGDIIYYKDIEFWYSKYIYDGCNIIMLEYDFDEQGHIPREFTVINNDVPTNYWVDSKENRGLPSNNYVSFNHDTVRQQLIDNIQIEHQNDTIFTTFIFNNKKYIIFFDSCEDCSRENFKNKLRGKQLFLKYIKYDTVKKFHDFKEDIPDSVLYLNGDFNEDI